jgi:hypothetical protein
VNYIFNYFGLKARNTDVTPQEEVVGKKWRNVRKNVSMRLFVVGSLLYRSGHVNKPFPISFITVWRSGGRDETDVHSNLPVP